MSKDTIISNESGKFMAVGCTHGDLIDKTAFKTFMSRRRHYKPEHMFHLGDAFEFTALRKGATDDEKRISIEKDIKEGLWMFSRIFKGIRGQRWFMRGNHCERLWQMKDKGTAIGREFANEKIYQIESFLADHDIQMKPYCSRKGVIMVNDTCLMHGYGHGLNAAKDHLKAYHHNLIFCHTHRAEHAVAPAWPKPIEALNIGCMRELYPEFASRGTSTLSWRHAFAKGRFNSDNTSTRELVIL